MNFPDPPSPSTSSSSSPSPSLNPRANLDLSPNLSPTPGHGPHTAADFDLPLHHVQQHPDGPPQQPQQQQRQQTPPPAPSHRPARFDRHQHAPPGQTTQSDAAQRAADAQAAATARAVQAQHQHIQLQNLLALQNGTANWGGGGGGAPAMNGMNGAGAGMQMQGAGVNPGAAMAVGPTPAGHQAELNIIYGLVEELSRQLAENRRQTEDIVNGIGRVRNRARERDLGNDELLGEAADELYAQEPNTETLISVLTESLDRAKNSRDANFNLLTSYARVLSALLGQFHAYKQKHIADVSAWHRSYRAQLAEARSENSRLREQVWEMQEHAGRANKLLREFRKRYDEDEARADRRVEDRARRQEIRFWKRMAMPEVADSDEAVWSDDDDIVDPIEKERLREVERKVAEQALAGLGSGDSQQGDDSEGEEGMGGGHPGMGILGGVAMEREGSMPTPPPRPASTGSTGGQTG